MYDLIQDVFYYRLRLGTVLHLVRHSQNVATLTHEVLQVGVLAFVCQLGQTHLLLRKFIV
jgi:hypothetical protein